MTGLLYPSKRPKVSQVKQWQTIWNDEIHNHWRGDDFSGVATVSVGYPFADYYRVVFTPVVGKRVTKYFYGEMAVYEVRNFVDDLGFRSAYTIDM